MSVATQNPESWPQMLPGFDHVSRSWDAVNAMCAAKILPGEYYVTRSPEVITTVLGSCVSACIRDTDTGVGGMNHFMLPGDTTASNSKWAGMDCLETRFGVAAMELLINDILKLGSRKKRLEVKLFGGGDILQMDLHNIGQRNVEFVREFVKLEQLSVASEDLGGPYPRKIVFFPKSGKVMVKRLRSLQNRAVAAQEKQYESALCKEDKAGDIDLFG